MLEIFAAAGTTNKNFGVRAETVVIIHTHILRVETSQH